MYINLEFWISGLLQHFFRDIQYNSDNIIITINAWDAIFVKIFGFHCNWIGRNWQSDWIQLQYIRIFDAMVWTIPFEVILLDKLIHIAWTMYLQRHSKGGYENIWIYLVCCYFVWTGIHAAFYSGIYRQIAGWFHQVSPTDGVQIVVFGVCWKAALCQYIWNDYNDVWRYFRGEQNFGKKLKINNKNVIFRNYLELILPRMMCLFDTNDFQIVFYFESFCILIFWDNLEKTIYFLGRCFCRILESEFILFINI